MTNPRFTHLINLNQDQEEKLQKAIEIKNLGRGGITKLLMAICESIIERDAELSEIN